MRVKVVDIKKLKRYPDNPRIHPDAAISKLKRSVEEFGWTNPILASSDGYILAGHARIKVAKDMGMKKVPVIYLPLKGAKAVAYMVADNRIQENTDWDLEILEKLIKRLGTTSVDLAITGFDEEELEDLFREFDIDGLELEVNEPKKPGEHKLKRCPNCGREF